ncbi:AraC family transcriptional regulator [Persicirhabdus sediminis]|uniref:AraC family transcriptional regulator n=1 Tax=Persicirhabdus sediminis TaxID=454144 RepID=A0A8J7ME91_9BACT|nr:AraC family transcriptional regulator [Persicirhabdus sediminis]MBK1792294.1 AraC family transcriptional regulator [Persicirhabdus sediminis]
MSRLRVDAQCVDSLREKVCAWDLDFMQLEKGGLAATIEQAALARLLMTRGQFSRKLEQRGGSPVGYRTFGFSLNPESPFSWRGHSVEANKVLLFPQNGELYAVSEPGFHVMTVSVPEAYFDAYLDKNFSLLDQQRLKRQEVFECSDRAMNQLRQTFSYALRGEELAPAQTGWLESEMMTALFGACIEGQDLVSLRAGRRQKLVLAATESIEQMGGHKLNICELSTELGVSVRTLEYAFRDHYQLGPKAYSIAYRMAQVRRELLRMDGAHGGVAAVASAWGFKHLGKFSASYRQFFGELPSQTLAERHGA